MDNKLICFSNSIEKHLNKTNRNCFLRCICSSPESRVESQLKKKMSSRGSRTRVISRVFSVFSRGDYQTPLESLKKVKIDSYLISLGLISQHFGVESKFGQSFWKRSHQLFVLWLEWVMFAKWLFCGITEDEILTPEQTGDFTSYLPGEVFNYHFILIFWSAIGAISCSIFSMARDHQKLNLLWLQPFELCKGTLKPQDMKMETQETSYFWQRVLLTLWFTKILSRILFVIMSGAYLYVVFYLGPKFQWTEWNTFWTMVTVVWLYYNTSIQFGVMAVFHMICYYFIVKFRRLNEIVKEFEGNPKMDLMSMHQKLNHYMNHHNTYAKEVANYNKFWQYYIVMDFSISITIICFIIEMLLFVKMNLFVQTLSLIIIFSFTLFLIFTAFSAAAVSEEVLPDFN